MINKGYSQIIIDDFSTNQAEVTVTFPPTGSIGSTTANSMAGGERDILATLTQGTIAGNSVSISVGGNTFNYTQTNGVSARAAIAYDGIDGLPAITNPTGLGGLDLTDSGNQDAIRVSIHSTDIQAQVSFFIYTSALDFSSLVLNVPSGISTETHFEFSFNNFNVGGGVGADFTNVGAIVFFILPQNGEANIKIGTIQTTKIQPVPPMAYICFDANGPGTMNDDSDPFATIQAALDAGAKEIRIKPGTYIEDVAIDTDSVQARTWNGLPGNDKQLDIDGKIILDGNLTINEKVLLILIENFGELELNGNLDLFGSLELKNGRLVMNADEETNLSLTVYPVGDLVLPPSAFPCQGVQGQFALYRYALRNRVDSLVLPSQELREGLQAIGYFAKSQSDHEGLLRFIGPGSIDVKIETSTDRLRFDFPEIEIDGPTVTFDGNGVPATNSAPDAPNHIDVLGIPMFTFISGKINLANGIDHLDVSSVYQQLEGEFLMAGESSPGGSQTVKQEICVGSDFNEEDGEFLTQGGDVTVFGDFNLGCSNENGSDALLDLSFNGTHSVVGDFCVGENTNPDERNVDADNDGDIDWNRLERNRYFLGDGNLNSFGDFTFQGTGDKFDDDLFFLSNQGLEGNVFFLGGNGAQNVDIRQDEDAYFNNVILASRNDDNSGLVLASNVFQNDEGTLTLDFGIIDTKDEEFDWVIFNPGIETDLAKRNNSEKGKGVVDLGSKSSYITGAIERTVEFGNAAGGNTRGGYLFPVGGTENDANFFRPLLLQFPDDLGRSSLARVDYRDDLLNEDLEFPETGIVVDAGNGEDLLLDVLSFQFWQLEFDRIPSVDPNIRVEADELPNVFDLKSLRLIQWDCDGTNPRLAGTYDLVGPDPSDDPSFLVNDHINGVPNISQEGVDVKACQLIGIASNLLINPIHLPDHGNLFSFVQLVNSVPDAGPVDIYKDDVRIVDDLDFQTATPFAPILSNKYKLDIVAGDQVDNENPFFSQEITPVTGKASTAIISGKNPNFQLITVDESRLVSDDPNLFDFFIVHGAPDVESIDIRLLDPLQNNAVIGLLANDFKFGDITEYQSLSPGLHVMDVTNTNNSQVFEVFRFDFTDFDSSAVALLLSPTNPNNTLEKSNQSNFDLVAINTNGKIIEPTVITSVVSNEKLPATFSLSVNYPNPFNPTTTINYGIPQESNVRLTIYNLNGQLVSILADGYHSGGFYSVKWDGRSEQGTQMASGMYLYKIEADGFVKTRKMMLMK